MFKVNDKVKIIDTDYGSDELQNGQTGVITRTQLLSDGGTVMIGVSMDNGFTPYQFDPSEDGAWNFFEYQLELTE